MSELEWLDIFAGNLAEILWEIGMTQKELAELTGLSEGTISKYLTRQQMPGVKALVNIGYALNIDLNELIDFGDRIT